MSAHSLSRLYVENVLKVHICRGKGGSTDTLTLPKTILISSPAEISISFQDSSEHNLALTPTSIAFCGFLNSAVGDDWLFAQPIGNRDTLLAANRIQFLR